MTCTTHHYACDCREQKFAKLEARIGESRIYAQNLAEKLTASEIARARAVGAVDAHKQAYAEECRITDNLRSALLSSELTRARIVEEAALLCEEQADHASHMESACCVTFTETAKKIRAISAQQPNDVMAALRELVISYAELIEECEATGKMPKERAILAKLRELLGEK